MPPGRTPSFGYEDVARVCEGLHTRGALTLDNVRTELGRGSKSTLLAHYQAWKAQRTERAQAPADAALPEDLRAAWANGLAQVRAEAADEFKSQVGELRQQLQWAQDSLQQSETRAGELETHLEAAHAAAAAAKIKADTELAELRGSLTESSKQLDTLRQELEREQLGAEKARNTAAEANIRAEAAQTSIATLAQDNKELRQGLEALRQNTAQALQDAAVAQAHLKDRNGAVTTLAQDLQSTRAELQALRTEHLAQLQRAEAAERRAEVCETKAQALLDKIQNQGKRGKPEG